MREDRNYSSEQNWSNANADADTTDVGGRVPPVRGYVLQSDEYTLTGGKAVWRLAERWICEREGWKDVDESTHDAETSGGEKVEIKSCVWRTEEGKIGKVKLWDSQKLNADKVAVVVYAPTRPESVIGYTVVDSSAVPCNSRQRRHNTMGWAHVHPLPWPTILGLSDIRPGLRHAFLDFFNDGEYDEVVVFEAPDWDEE